ncbi:ESC reductase, partial [Aureobasidium melanogenum]
MSSTDRKSLAGKVALVTGSSRGIGAAIALRLASHGADVVINYISSASAAEEVANRARSFGVRAFAIKADVSQADQIKAMFEKAIAEFGKLDIVMSNSGIEHFGELAEILPEDIDRVLGVNVKAQFMVAQQAFKYLGDNGRLVLISSVSAVMGFPNHALYSASKAAIQGMVRSLAWDFGKRNITVNCIAPGGIKTDMYAEAAAKYIPGGDKMSIEDIDAKVSQWSPLGRPGFPNDIAGVVALLASEEAQWITGQTMHVNGGTYMV